MPLAAQIAGFLAGECGWRSGGEARAQGQRRGSSAGPEKEGQKGGGAPTLPAHDATDALGSHSKERQREHASAEKRRRGRGLECWKDESRGGHWRTLECEREWRTGWVGCCSCWGFGGGEGGAVRRKMSREGHQNCCWRVGCSWIVRADTSRPPTAATGNTAQEWTDYGDQCCDRRQYTRAVEAYREAMTRVPLKGVVLNRETGANGVYLADLHVAIGNCFVGMAGLAEQQSGDPAESVRLQSVRTLPAAQRPPAASAFLQRPSALPACRCSVCLAGVFPVSALPVSTPCRCLFRR